LAGFAKIQAPSSKIKAPNGTAFWMFGFDPNKLQNQSSKRPRLLEFGPSDLFGFWCLELGF
jgi:hypothetical protein